jgi:hypothetical protein
MNGRKFIVSLIVRSRAVIRFNIGYRWGNGDVEGFSAFRFGEQAAEAAAIGEIQNKCKAIDQRYDASQLIRDAKGLTPAERDRLKEDWHTYDRLAPGLSGLHEPWRNRTGYFG